MCVFGRKRCSLGHLPCKNQPHFSPSPLCISHPARAVQGQLLLLFHIFNCAGGFGFVLWCLFFGIVVEVLKANKGSCRSCFAGCSETLCSWVFCLISQFVCYECYHSSSLGQVCSWSWGQGVGFFFLFFSVSLVFGEFWL